MHANIRCYYKVYKSKRVLTLTTELQQYILSLFEYLFPLFVFNCFYTVELQIHKLLWILKVVFKMFPMFVYLS